MKAKRRHPNPKNFERKKFKVAHITFETCDHPENGKTFALIAGDALLAKDRRPLFTGFIIPGMARQLRELAFEIDQLEADL